jgi:hypothetical protein
MSHLETSGAMEELTLIHPSDDDDPTVEEGPGG